MVPRWWYVKDRCAQDVRMKKDDRMMWVSKGMKWCQGVLYAHRFHFHPKAVREFKYSILSCSLSTILLSFLLLSSSIDLKSHSHSMTHWVLVCSAPTATLMHCRGQSYSRDVDVLQRYDFISGLVNHFFLMWEQQLPSFEMCSLELVAKSLTYTTHKKLGFQIKFQNAL